jgi:archaellum biogenesis ATPase FlaH
MSEYKPQTIKELIANLSEYDQDQIVIGALFLAGDLPFTPDDSDETTWDTTPSQELMAKVAECYDNSDEAMYLSDTLVAWAKDHYKKEN